MWAAIVGVVVGVLWGILVAAGIGNFSVSTGTN
jgi:hypothetical protein